MEEHATRLSDKVELNLRSATDTWCASLLKLSLWLWRLARGKRDKSSPFPTISLDQGFCCVHCNCLIRLLSALAREVSSYVPTFASDALVALIVLWASAPTCIQTAHLPHPR